MHFGKAIIATDSHGIADYLVDGFNGLKCPPFSAVCLADSITRLWNAPEEAERQGRNGSRFVVDHCSETTARANLAEALRHFDLLRDQPAVPVIVSA
jgi:glycosyltransferase involved in cell wall biosynthesis